MKKLLVLFVLASCLSANPTGWTEVNGVRVVNDCNAIRSAMDSNVTIVIPLTCYLDTSLKINNLTNVTIEGGTLYFSSPIGFEILGSNDVILHDVRINMQGGDVGVFVARTSNYSAWMNLDHVTIYGTWSQAGIYCVSCESLTINDSTVQGQNPEALSNVTYAGFNEYNINTSIPIDNTGKGVYRALITNSFIVGQSVTSIRAFGVGLTVRDTFISNFQDYGIELLSGRGLTLDNVAFEGANIASVKETGPGTYTLDIRGGLGGSAQYGIYADSGTITTGRIGRTGTLPLHFGHLVYVDLLDWALFDSRANSITAQVCSGVQVSLGQGDTFTCQTYNGVNIYSHAVYWSPTGYNE